MYTRPYYKELHLLISGGSWSSPNTFGPTPSGSKCSHDISIMEYLIFRWNFVSVRGISDHFKG